MAYLDYDGLAYFKGKLDASYPNITVGNANQLLADNGVEDKVPYNFRRSGGGADVGDREIDKIVGGTIAWNQLVSADNFRATGGTVSTDANHVATFTASASGQQVYRDINLLKDHIVIAAITYKTTIGTSDVKMRAFAMDINGIASTNWQTVYAMQKIGTTGTQSVGVVDRRASGWDAIYAKNAMFIDLTKMFGATIADHIYALEQATTGAGVAFFKSLFPKAYYPYNAGELMSVNTSAHEMVGFNQWDEETRAGYYTATGVFTPASGYVANKNKIPVIPSINYHFECTSGGNFGRICYYDANDNFISYALPAASSVNILIPSNVAYINFDMSGAYGGAYKNDICINISSSKNGTYEPYKKWSYPLDDSLTLRGIPKLDANNKLYYDGDTYESDGTVTRRYGTVNLGDLNWTYNSQYFIAELIGIKSATSWATSCELVCAKYSVSNGNAINGLTVDKAIASVPTANTIWLRDTGYTTTSALKTALSGVYLVYELATPTTETADPYTNPQNLDPYGTEEYVDERTVAVPVGHDTFYPENLRAKIEGLPSDFSTLIAPTEATYKATRAYTANDFFIVNNILYKATTSIASGATITPNTNCTATTIGAVLKSLLA